MAVEQEDFKTLQIPIAFNRPGYGPGGLNLVDASVGFAGRYSPNMINMKVDGDKVRKRLGYSIFGSASLPLTGTGMGMLMFVDARGAEHLIAVTTSNAYEYDVSSSLWVEITPVAADLTGSSTYTIVADVVTDVATFLLNGGQALVMTNGVDDLVAYEGDPGGKFTTLAHTFPSFSSCRTVIEFENHVMLLDYTDSARNAKSLAYAAIGNVTDWVGAGAGQVTLTDSVGIIQRAMKLGSVMALYSDQSIINCQYVGGTSIFVFPKVISGTGLLAPQAIAELSNCHYFVGTDGIIYKNEGWNTLTNVGKPINQAFFNMLDGSKKAQIRVGIDQAPRRKILFAIPSSSDTYATRVFALNFDKEGLPWEYYELAHSIRGLASFIPTAALYCDTTTWSAYYCDDISMYCDSALATSGTRITVFLTDTGYTFELDDTTGLDYDKEIAATYETEDATLDKAETNFRSIWVSFEAKSYIAGSTVDMWYSLDSGSTWIQLVDSPVSLSSTWTTSRIPLDTVSNKIRFKLYQKSAGDLQLRGSIYVGVQLGSARS